MIWYYFLSTFDDFYWSRWIFAKFLWSQIASNVEIRKSKALQVIDRSITSQLLDTCFYSIFVQFAGFKFSKQKFNENWPKIHWKLKRDIFITNYTFCVFCCILEHSNRWEVCSHVSVLLIISLFVKFQLLCACIAKVFYRFAQFFIFTF